MVKKCYNIKKTENKNKTYVEKTLKEFAGCRFIRIALFNPHGGCNGRFEHQLRTGFFSNDELHRNWSLLKLRAPWSCW